MTDDMLTDALRVHYTDQLDPIREVELVAQVPSRRPRWMPWLLVATTLAVLLFAWVRSNPAPTPTAPRGQWYVTTDLTLMKLSDAALAHTGDIPPYELVELRTVALESAAGEVVFQPTVTSASGQEATVEVGARDSPDIALGVIATGEPGDWELFVTLNLPEFDSSLTWTGHDDSERPNTALVAVSDEAGWVLLVDVVDAVVK